MNTQEVAFAAFRWTTAMLKQFPWLSAFVIIAFLFVISAIVYMAKHLTTGIPVAISRVQQSAFVNYAGFPVPTPEDDAQVMSFGEVTITNISEKEKVALDLNLRIEGADGTSFSVPANLRGPFGTVWGKDDKVAKYFATAPIGEPQKHFRNPVELSPGQVERRQLDFIFNFSGLRDRIVSIVAHDQNYTFDLEVVDLISGGRTKLRLPGEYRGDR